MNTKPTLLSKYFFVPYTKKTKPTESFLRKKRQSEALEKINKPLLKLVKMRYSEAARIEYSLVDEVKLQEKLNRIEEAYARDAYPSDSESD